MREPDQRKSGVPDAADRRLRHDRGPGRQRRKPCLHQGNRPRCFLPGPASAPHRPGRRQRATTVDVLNGGHTTGLAKRIRPRSHKRATGRRWGTPRPRPPRSATARRGGAARPLARMFGAPRPPGARCGPVSPDPARHQRHDAGRPAVSPPSPAAVIPSTGPQGGAVPPRTDSLRELTSAARPPTPPVLARGAVTPGRRTRPAMPARPVSSCPASHWPPGSRPHRRQR